MLDPSLTAMAELAGIATQYNDVFGQSHDVSEDVITQLLACLGFAHDDETSLARLKAAHESLLPPVKLLTAEQPTQWRVRGALRAVIHSEDGNATWELPARRGRLELPGLTFGYYQLDVELPDGRHTCLLLVAPKKTWSPDAIRQWGVAVQLYGLHSENSLGMGDFSDLASLCKQSAVLGAGLVGLNPMHVGFYRNPEHISPYSPSSRLFLNPLYIDPRAIEGFDASMLPKDFAALVLRAQNAEFVDYPLVAEIKQAVFEKLYSKAFPIDSDSFRSFCAEMGDVLTKQALFDTLGERFGPSWQHWPEAYQNPDSDEVRAFTDASAARLNFYRWLYWQADKQLAGAQAKALDAGMAIGLYRDLAVGPDKSGAEVWQDKMPFIHDVSVGAPPDELNPGGQNWGLPAFNPFTLRKQGFAPFIALLRANMRHAKALRIDHAFGLSRLYLIPEGMHKGTYLRYPFADLLAVLKIESHRNQCLVIGEDLGTFPPDYQEAAHHAGVYSYKVFYFERDEKGYVPPKRYPQQALATLSTHDLPTLAGWEQGDDIAERSRLGLYPTPELEQRDRDNRPRDKERLGAALAREGLQHLSPLEGISRYLARSNANIVMTQLEDVLGVVPPANLPGTTDQRPNWRMKLPASLPQVIEALNPLAKAMNEERKKDVRNVPRATYRLQFHKDFTFYDAAKIIPYLAKLGVSHVYASPYFKARPGSTHGYDITDHNALNPELGGDEGFQVFCDAIKTHGLKQLLDFVPNHMGVGGSDNQWWLNLLEWGQKAPEATYFDVDWNPRYPGAAAKLLLPMLGDHYGDVLDAGELNIKFDAAEGAFSAWYFAHRFPICPKDYVHIDADILSIEESVEAGLRLKQGLADDTHRHAALVDAAKHISADHESLHRLLERQNYRLAFWRVASSDINYRRFFDINDLAGLRVENSELFDKMHRRVLSLIAEGQVHGLRIDHIDGLADPAGYLDRLREKMGAKTYLTVEKILGPNETLPGDWACDGTSGYDALNHINSLFVEPNNKERIDRIYRKFTDERSRFPDMVADAKAMILETGLASEWRVLSLAARRLAAQDRYHRDYPYDSLKIAIRDVIAYYPVYRAYATEYGIGGTDRARIAHAVSAAKRRSGLVDLSIYDFLGQLLDGSSNDGSAEYLNFVRRFQQVSGPVMAKGVEDTSFYRYFRLLALNEVGGDPGVFGISAKTFHDIQRKANAHSMIATATHDTKRGEDARMRLAALSELPREWLRTLIVWERAVNQHRGEQTEDIIDKGFDYFLLQTLLASWPLELMTLPLQAEALSSYRQRLHEYLTKAMREGKRYTNWNNPDEAYESGMHALADALLDDTSLIENVLPFAANIAQKGAINSLAQVILKMTLPGVPDIYQGSESWDFSFVDPDNRRPVDYEELATTLGMETLSELLPHWHDGRVKQNLLHRLLQHRLQYTTLYRDGEYQEIALNGHLRKHALAFRRAYKGNDVVVVIPLRVANLSSSSWPLGKDLWADTRLNFPVEGWTNILTGEKVTSRLGDIFASFPGAVLVRR